MTQSLKLLHQINKSVYRRLLALLSIMLIFSKLVKNIT